MEKSTNIISIIPDRKTKHLLVDTCSLLSLISEEGYSTYLSILENCVNHREIILYTHEIVINEWNKHKLQQQNRKEKNLLYRKNNPNSEFLPAIKNNTSHLETQINQIDKLLSSSHILETPEIIKNEFAQRYEERLAPFHRFLDSRKDWFIIGSYLNYCVISGIKECFFLSSNTREFENENKSYRKIHTTLENRFSSLSIIYYSDNNSFFDDLKSANTVYFDTIQTNLSTNEKYSYKSTIRKNVLSSLDYLYNDLYRDISFIPVHILLKYYPFSDPQKRKPYYSGFIVEGVHQDFIKFLESFEIINNSTLSFKDNLIITEEEIGKLKRVLSKLTHNLVYGVCLESVSEEINTTYETHNECDCCRCSFNKFNFYKALTNINEYNSIEEKLRAAYIHYSLGNFYISSRLFTEISVEASSSKRFILYFIAKYNLKHIALFLNSYYYSEELDSQLVDSLKSIDPIEEAVNFKPHSDYDLLLFIAQEDFFTQAYQKIKIAVDNIVSHYYSQLKGGWSSNNNIEELTQEFTKVERFINENFIVYDKYENFINLFEMLMEGLFASLAIKEKGGSRLLSLSDYWLNLILLYGRKSTIIKYFNRYKLKTIDYDSDNDNKNLFITNTHNFFSNMEKSEDILQITKNLGNKYFNEFYANIFDNFVTVATILNLNSNNLEDFSETLINFLKLDSKNNNRRFDVVDIFIKNKGKKFNEKILYKYFNFFRREVTNRNLNLLVSIIKSFKKNIIISKTEYTILAKNVIETLVSDYYTPQDVLYFLCKKFDTKHKNNLKIIIEDLLTKNFNFNVYYASIIYNIIPFDPADFNLLLDKYEYNKNQSTFHSLFTGVEEYTDNHLNNLINIIFKQNIDVSIENFTKIKNTHLYYSWVIDMENFDYNHFNPDWIYIYETKYYYERMSKSRKLIMTLVDYCKKESNSKVDRALINITNFSYYLEKD